MHEHDRKQGLALLAVSFACGECEGPAFLKSCCIVGCKQSKYKSYTIGSGLLNSGKSLLSTRLHCDAYVHLLLFDQGLLMLLRRMSYTGESHTHCRTPA